MTRAALYLRVSDQSQIDGHSLGTHEADGRAYCAERGYEIVGVYREVFTGVYLDARPEVSRLRRDIEEGKLDVAVVWHSDRLSRDQDDRVYLRVEANRHGARYEFVKDPAGHSEEDRLVEYIRGYAAKLEWRRIRERSVANVRARVEREGKLIPSNRPRYGYLWADPSPGEKGGYVENPDQGWIVRLIFERIASGTPVKTLCRQLEERGIKAPKGGDRWRTSTLTNLVRCSMYRGEAFAYVAQTEKRADGRRKRTTRHRAEWVALPEGTVAALVDPALWEEANDQLDRLSAAHMATRYAPGMDPEDALSRGHVRCACGYRMYVKRLADGPYYACQARARRANDCPSNMIKAETIDRMTWARVKWLLLDPSVVLAGQEPLRQTERMAEEEHDFDRQIREATAREDSLLDALGRGLAGPALERTVTRLNEASAYRAALVERKAEVQTHRRLLEERDRAIRDLTVMWAETDEALRAMGYAERRERLRRLGVEIVVNHKGSGRPRYEIRMEPPIPWEDFALPTYEEIESQPHRPITIRRWHPDGTTTVVERGNSPRFRQGDSTHQAPCADTAGGTPPRSRTAPPPRSPS